MRHIEVLFIRNESEAVEDVFLRRGSQVLRESIAHFNCRMTRPHMSLYEIRYVYREDSRLTEYLATLRRMARDYGFVSNMMSEAFQEMFLVGTGFYMPDALADFD